MSEDLGEKVSSTRGQGPSPDFVVALRQRVAAESEARPQHDSALGTALVTEVDLTPKKEKHMGMTRKVAIGLVAAAIVLFAGFAIVGTSGDSSDVIVVTDDPAETTSTTASGTGSGEPSPDDLLGTWNASFGPTWRFEADQIVVTGGAISSFDYVAFDTMIQVSDDSGCPFGMYGWQIEDDVLTLTLINDDCGGRNDNLDGATFERADE